MDHNDEIDHAEHDYWKNHCPACDHSPCIGERCQEATADLDEWWHEITDAVR